MDECTAYGTSTQSTTRSSILSTDLPPIPSVETSFNMAYGSSIRQPQDYLTPASLKSQQQQPQDYVAPTSKPQDYEAPTSKPQDYEAPTSKPQYYEAPLSHVSQQQPIEDYTPMMPIPIDVSENDVLYESIPL